MWLCWSSPDPHSKPWRRPASSVTGRPRRRLKSHASSITAKRDPHRPARAHVRLLRRHPHSGYTGILLGHSLHLCRHHFGLGDLLIELVIHFLEVFHLENLRLELALIRSALEHGLEMGFCVRCTQFTSAHQILGHLYWRHLGGNFYMFYGRWI